MHKCNEWCFDGVHALLYDSVLSDIPSAAEINSGRADFNREEIPSGVRIAQQLASMAGLSFLGMAEVRAPGLPPGSPTADGLTRGRMVIWAR